MSLKASRHFLWAIIIALLLWNILQLEKGNWATRLSSQDFIEYWASCRLFTAGVNPYDPSLLLSIERLAGWPKLEALVMWNPPWTLPLILPFSFIPYRLSAIFWFLLNLSLLLVSADWFWRQYRGPESHRWIAWLAPMFFFPSRTALSMGQISPFIFAGLAGFCWAQKRNRHLLAGTFTLFLAIKPHVLYLFWMILMFWIVKNRLWNILLGVLTALFISTFFVLCVNPDVLLHYYNAITSSHGPTIWQTPTWGLALILLFKSDHAWIRLIPVFFGVLITTWLWFRWKSHFDWFDKLPVIILLSIVTGSFSWSFDWVVFLPVLISFLILICMNLKHLWWLLAALILSECILTIQSYLNISDFYAIWYPLVFWLLYTIGAYCVNRLTPRVPPLESLLSKAM